MKCQMQNEMKNEKCKTQNANMDQHLRLNLKLFPYSLLTYPTPTSLSYVSPGSR